MNAKFQSINDRFSHSCVAHQTASNSYSVDPARNHTLAPINNQLNLLIPGSTECSVVVSKIMITTKYPEDAECNLAVSQMIPLISLP